MTRPAGSLASSAARLTLVAFAVAIAAACSIDDEPRVEPDADTDPVAEDQAGDEDEDAGADDAELEPEPEDPPEPAPTNETDAEPAPAPNDADDLWARAEAGLERLRLPDEAAVEVERTDTAGVLEGTLDPGIPFNEARQLLDEVFDGGDWTRLQQGSGGSDEEQFAIWEYEGHGVEVLVELTGHGPADTTDIDGLLRVSARE